MPPPTPITLKLTILLPQTPKHWDCTTGHHTWPGFSGFVLFVFLTESSDVYRPDCGQHRCPRYKVVQSSSTWGLCPIPPRVFLRPKESFP